MDIDTDALDKDKKHAEIAGSDFLPRVFYFVLYCKHKKDRKYNQVYAYPEEYGINRRNDSNIIELKDDSAGAGEADKANEEKLKKRRNYFLQLKVAKETLLNRSLSNAAPVVIGEPLERKESANDKPIIRIIRKWEYDSGTNSKSSTIGTFTIDNDILSGYILEPYGTSTIESGKDKRIPAGEYNLTWHLSENFTKDKYSKKNKGRYLNNGFPKLFNGSVSQSRGILIHIGNTGMDSEGCLLPGQSIAVTTINNKKYATGVESSTDTFYKLIDYIEKQGIENVKIIITEKYEDYK
jgi:hypothetical protein